MIKFVRMHRGRHLVVLGLSDVNIERLRSNQPIMVQLSELHPDLPDVSVIVTAGATERDIMEDLEAVGLVPQGAAAKLPVMKPGDEIRQQF